MMKPNLLSRYCELYGVQYEGNEQALTEALVYMTNHTGKPQSGSTSS